MKNRMGKRIFSLLLSLIMAVGVLPMSALAYTIDVNGTEVDLTFGKELDPNTVLDSKYDIKAMGSIQMKADINGTDKLMAEGRVELLVPYSIFENAVNGKVQEGVDKAVNPALEKYDTEIANALSRKVPFNETVDIVYNGVTVKKDYQVSFNSTPAEIIETIRSGRVNIEGVDYGFYHEFLDGGLKGALQKLAESAASEAGVTLKFGKTSEGKAGQNWIDTTADASSDADEQAEKLGAVIGLLWAKKNLSAEVRVIIGDIKVYDGGVYKTKDEIKAELEVAITEEVTDTISGYVDNLLDDIQNSFYGKLDPTDDEETLTGRFNTLDEVVEGFVEEVSDVMGDYDVGDLSGVKIDMPTDQISSLENMLKSIVKELNNTDEDPAIQGTIIGLEDTDKLSECKPTGMYVVAGVNSEDTNDMIYKPYVLAPAVAPVTIKNGDADMGYFMHATVGDTLNITAEVGSGYDDGNLMQLRFTGVQTDGKVFDSDKNASDIPTEAGVYTVFSLYFDEDTLAMGGDVAVLVIEPQTAEDFNVTNKEQEVDGDEHFANINTAGQAVVKVAVDQDADEVYVKLPDGFGDKAGAATDQAETIVNRFETTMEKYLPVPDRVTAKILGALAKLEEVAVEAEGRKTVTSTAVKDRLTYYMDAIIEWYSKDKVMDEAAEAVDKVKTELQTNATVSKYRDMMKSVLESFDLSDFTPKMRAAETPEQKLVNEFIDRFMTEIKGNKDDIKALLTYIADYADNSSYKQDAVTMIKTLGTIGKVDTSVVDPAVTAVEGAFTTLKNEMTALILSIDDVPGMDDAEAALGYLEKFVKTVMGEAKEIVKAFNIDTLYLGSLPSEAGMYDCYAVNVSTNYMPTLKNATLTLTETQTEVDVTIKADNKAVEKGKTVDLTYTQVGADGETFDVTLKVLNGGVVVDNMTSLEPGQYTIQVSVADKAGYAVSTENGTLNVCQIKTHKEHGATLSLKGVVYVEYGVKLEGFADGVDFATAGGAVVWTGSDEVTDRNQLQVNAEHCEEVPGMELVDDAWLTTSLGISAKDYGKTIYMRAYVEVKEGCYIYGPAIKYSVETYCRNKLNNDSTAVDVKETCAALLNYGAAAQNLFDEDLDHLVNADWDFSAYDLEFKESMIDALNNPTAEKANTLTGERTSAISSAKATLSLKGAIVYDLKYTIDIPNMATAQVLFWTEEAYNNTDTLAYEDNTYSYVVDLKEETIDGEDVWVASSEMVPAKEIGDTLYYSVRVVDIEGNVYRGGLGWYNADKYIWNNRENSDPEIAAVVKALAVYSEKARILFGY